MRALLEQLRALGARPRHEQRLLRAWLRGGRLITAQRPDQPLPTALLAALPAIEARLDGAARVAEEHTGADGSARLLIRLADGQSVESVLLPRGGLCVSSQVGCAVGCTFCWTGRSGLARQLSSLEIAAQVVLARRRRQVRRVVFMGMGEPAHNLDAVLEALELLGTHGELGHKHMVVSTVGDERLFERLASASVRPALALSLHTTDSALRERLLPRAPRIEPAVLIERAERYARLVTWPFQLQWTVLAGVNDTDAELQRLTSLMQGRHGIVNFIPWNVVEGQPWARPAWERLRAMSQHLHRHGVLCKLRRSAGQDVEGACGQLRARAAGRRSASADPARAAGQPAIPSAGPGLRDI